MTLSLSTLKKNPTEILSLVTIVSFSLPLKQLKTVASCHALISAVAIIFAAMLRADTVAKLKYLVCILGYLGKVNLHQSKIINLIE